MNDGAVGRFRLWPRRIPFVQQLAATECGAACLAMVLGYYGKTVRINDLREYVGGRGGANALTLIAAAQRFGLQGHGVTLEIDDLDALDRGAVLHWEFNHFVVFERRKGDAVDVLDPAHGRRRVRMEEFRKSFTGVALMFEPTDAFEPGRVRSSSTARYVKQILAHAAHWRRILVMSLMMQLFALAVPVLTGALVDRVVPRGDHHLLTVLALGLAVIVAFQWLASMVRTYFMLELRTRVDEKMTLAFLDHMVDLPYAFFQGRSTGDLMMRLNSNATIREILTSGALSGLLDGSLVGIYLILLAAVSPPMAAVVLILAALQVASLVATRRAQRELLAQNLQMQAKSESYQVELFSGIETLKAMGSEQRAVEHWTGLFHETLNVAFARGKLGGYVEAYSSMLRLGSPLAVLLYGAWLVEHGDLTLGTMLALSALAAGFLGPLASLVATGGQLQLLKSYVERLDDVFESEREQDRDRARPSGELAGRIQLDDVSFRYDPLSPNVIEDASLAIEPGQFVAIVGRSGSGKSTLAALLLGLYAPQMGTVRYDGVELRELELRSVRRQLGIVMQRPFLFAGSIRSNIALSDPTLSLEEVTRAAKLAHVHDDIAAMNLGYETALVDGGASLAGGQRQRVALARALVRRPRILLLDEATSALDAITEAAVQSSLAELRCTRIVIAHRLSTIANADRIIVMQDGRIVESGTHQELLALGGAYAELVAAQRA